MQLPPLDPVQTQQMTDIMAMLSTAISEAGGRLPFDRFMELALYAPGHGYYVNGSRKFGRAGDFTTAPELSPVFSWCVAHHCAAVLDHIDGGDILEFGAGSGVMAAEVLAQLERLDRLPTRYRILELSAELASRQQQTLRARVPHLCDRVEWLQALPETGWRGVMLGNELLDAMPVHRFRWQGEQLFEQFVSVDGQQLVGQWAEPVSAGLPEAVRQLAARYGQFPDDYESELNLRLAPWLLQVAEHLEAGELLLIDYGYAGREYYHAERHRGTLICHYRHRAHDDPLLLPGLQDITASVDFSAVAHGAHAAGLAVAGYTTQAHFLLVNGLDRFVNASDPDAVASHLDLVQAVKMLTLPSEMGERFKVIGLTKGIGELPASFGISDLRGLL